MKKILRIIAFIAIGFWASEAQAQKVIKDGSSIYIDVQDMPSGTWSPTSLNYTHNEPDSYNKMYKRFEVAQNQISDSQTKSCSNGWRLPTQRELQLMFVMKDLLTNAGLNPLSSSSYWSSTGVSTSTNDAWFVNFSNGTTNNTARATTNTRRCIREVN